MRHQIIGYIEDNSIYVDGKKLEPDSSQRLCNYSPDGFNWGYAGAGPAQLALALLLHFRGDEDVIDISIWSEDFTIEVISQLKYEGDFVLPVSLVKEWIEEKKQISDPYLKEQLRPVWELNEEYRRLSKFDGVV